MRVFKSLNIVFLPVLLVFYQGFTSAQTLSDAQKNVQLQSDPKQLGESSNRQSTDLTNTSINSDSSILPPPSAQTSRFQDGEELILSLIIDNYKLGEVFTVYQSGRFYLHFEDFLTAVDFPIAQNQGQTTSPFTGWWANPENTFILEFGSSVQGQSGSVQSAELSDELYPKDFLEWFGDLFISDQALSRWFGADFEYDVSNQRVELTTSELWPIQQEVSRQNARLGERYTKSEAKENHYDPGYQTLSPQMMDLIGTLGRSNIGKDNEKTAFNYGLVGRNDLLNWSAKYFVGGTDLDYVSQAFVDFSKHYADPQQAPLGITSIQFGDVRPAKIRGKRISNARGVSISNKPLNVEFAQESTDISGYVQKGWDVELYQNDVLIAQQLNIESGRYEFFDVLLFAGENAFEVKKFGPQGQTVVEEIERFSQIVSSELFQPSYELSLIQNNISVFDLSPDQNQANNISLDGRYNMAISKGVNVNFEHSIVLDKDEEFAQENEGSDQEFLRSTRNTGQSSIISAGVSFRPLNNMAVTTNFSHVDEKFNNLNASVYTNLASQQIVLSADVYDDISDETENGRSSRVEMRATGKIADIGNTKLFHKTNYTYIENLDDFESHIFESGVTASLGRFSMNNNVSFARTRTQESGEYADNFSGIAGFSGAFGKTFIRGGVNYDMTNDFELENGFASVDYFWNPWLSSRASITKSFQDDFDRVSLGLDYKHDLFAINTRVDYSSLTGSSVFVSGRISVGEAPTEFGYINNRNSLTTNGTVLVRAFHDVNNNNIYDADDIPLKGVKLKALQGNRTEQSDVIGIAQFDNLSNFKKTDIAVDKTSLENPFLVQSTQLTSITPRPGSMILINYPFVEGAELEGEVTFIDEFNQIQYASNLSLVLIDSHGEIRHRFKTGFDGYFYVPGVIAHSYTLDIAPSAKSGAYRLDKPIPVKIEKQGQIISDLSFEVKAKTIATGYYVYTGQFNDASMVTLLYQTLLPHFENLGIMLNPFQHKLNNDKHALGITFSHNRAQAEIICSSLESYLKDCVIEAHRYFVEN